MHPISSYYSLTRNQTYELPCWYIKVSLIMSKVKMSWITLKNTILNTVCMQVCLNTTNSSFKKRKEKRNSINKKRPNTSHKNSPIGDSQKVHSTRRPKQKRKTVTLIPIQQTPSQPPTPTLTLPVATWANALRKSTPHWIRQRNHSTKLQPIARRHP